MTRPRVGRIPKSPNLRLVASLMVATGVMALALVLSVSSRSVHARRPPAVVRQLVGGGQWESRRDGRGQRDWQVELKRRDDGSVGGRVTVVGSPVLHEARLEGRLDGAEVYGVLLGPDDRQVGTFTGYRAARSLTGTYTFANGDSGTWSWSGAVPE